MDTRLLALVAVEFKTESQWRMLGFSLADGASAVPMHPTGFLGGKTCDYYHASDVEATDASPEFASAFAPFPGAMDSSARRRGRRRRFALPPSPTNPDGRVQGARRGSGSVLLDTSA